MAASPEAERIARVLAGERAAFDALFDEQLPALWRLATRLCDGPARAEALVHAVLAHALGRLDERPAGLSFADWLAALARERAPQRRRARAALRADASHADALHADA
jgi:DNA-directed RNA polymerase specialized sigma24 family protein